MRGLTVDHGDNPPMLITSENVRLGSYTYVGDDNYYNYLPSDYKNIAFLAKYFRHDPDYAAIAQDSRTGISGYIDTGKPPIVFLQETESQGSPLPPRP